MFDCFQKRAFNIGFFVHTDANVSVCFSQFDEIGQGIEIGFRFAVAVIQFLPLANHAEIAVVQGNDVHRNAVLEAGGQLLDVHLNRAFAGDTEYILIRSSQFRTDGIW
ncbi:Uncharacterised protein [Mycobacteroides abscessus subsp. massiliense]|nr:Uncharacterised protein [Mycobacteroides abscessus subsp. massiliense]